MAELINADLVRFKAVRARGPGGQRVNRRSTKVQLWVKINNLPLSDIEKKLIRQRLANHINQEDELEAVEEEESSQFLNKKKALAHLNQMVQSALKVKRPRIAAEPTREAKERRIREKKIESQKKKFRFLKHILIKDAKEI